MNFIVISIDSGSKLFKKKIKKIKKIKNVGILKFWRAYPRYLDINSLIIKYLSEKMLSSNNNICDYKYPYNI
jgi:hypothetical protein